MITRVLCASAACLLTLLAAPRAGRANNSFSIRINQSWIADSSFDVVSDNDHIVQAEFTYARRLLDLWRGELWVDGAWMGGTSKTTLFGEQVRSQAFLQTITFSARYAYPVYSWLVPYSRVGLGVGVGTFELQPSENGEEVLDRAASFTGHLLLGVEVLWPRRALLTGSSYLTAGVLIEAGYAFGTNLGFDIEPDEDDDLKQIPLSGADLGGLSTNGWQLRIGGILRF